MTKNRLFGLTAEYKEFCKSFVNRDQGLCKHIGKEDDTCDNPKDEGSSYCKAHRKIYFYNQPVKKNSGDWVLYKFLRGSRYDNN